MPATWYPRIPPFGMPLRTAAFRRLYEEAIGEALAVLDNSGRVYWIAEGTLIALLRFGQNGPGGRGRVVDEDIDVMVEVVDQADWAAVAETIAIHLKGRGWRGVELRTTAPEKAGSRLDMLRCWRRGHGALTRLDAHSYVVDYDSQSATVHGDPSVFPFQAWAGQLPLDHIYPLGEVRCYGRSAPCPHLPIEILARWNDGEYGPGSVATPRRRMSATELELLCASARRLERDGYCSMSAELQRAGLCRSEPEVFRDKPQ